MAHAFLQMRPSRGDAFRARGDKHDSSFYVLDTGTDAKRNLCCLPAMSPKILTSGSKTSRGPSSLAWVKERNTESMNELTRSDDFQALDRRILQILDSEDRIPAVQKLGPYYYNFWRDGKNLARLWRRTTLDEYKKAKPAWEVVLDLDLLGKEEKENWVWHGADVAQARLPAAL